MAAIDQLLDRLQGAIRFHAIGDALGSPHELRGRVPYQQYNGVIQFNIRYQTQYQGLRLGAVGQVSDDTELSLMMAYSLLAHRGYNGQDMARSYMEWANSGSVFIGINTRDLFKGVTTIAGYTKRWTDKFNPLLKEATSSVSLTIPDTDQTVIIPFNPVITQANGSLMRIVPLLTLFVRNDPGAWQAVISDVWLTNPSPINLEISFLYLQMGRMMLANASIANIMDYLISHTVQQPIKQAIQEVLSNTPRNVDTREKGWIVHAFYCAVWAVYRLDREPARALLDQIILMRGDADTNAAIAGGLIGLWHGWNQLGQDPIIQNNWTKIVIADLSQGDFIRPDKYHPKHYPEVIDRLLESF